MIRGSELLFEYRCDLLNEVGQRSAAWWFDAASDDEAFDYARSLFDEGITGKRFELWHRSELVRTWTLELAEPQTRKLERT